MTALLLASVVSGCAKPGICGDKDLIVEISGNHAHAELIPQAGLARGAGRYRIEGGSHEHGFRLTDAEVAQLKAGSSVELRSTSMNAHLHALRLSCAR